MEWFAYIPKIYQSHERHIEAKQRLAPDKGEEEAEQTLASAPEKNRSLQKTPRQLLEIGIWIQIVHKQHRQVPSQDSCSYVRDDSCFQESYIKGLLKVKRILGIWSTFKRFRTKLIQENETEKNHKADLEYWENLSKELGIPFVLFLQIFLTFDIKPKVERRKLFNFLIF